MAKVLAARYSLLGIDWADVDNLSSSLRVSAHDFRCSYLQTERFADLYGLYVVILLLKIFERYDTTLIGITTVIQLQWFQSQVVGLRNRWGRYDLLGHSISSGWSASVMADCLRFLLELRSKRESSQQKHHDKSVFSPRHDEYLIMI